MKVLLQNSHHSSNRPDGWSGAPGEAAYIVALNTIIKSYATGSGITVTTVDGDYGGVPNDNDQAYIGRHPEFQQDYDLFFAPHYESNTHAPIDLATGQFWGRAIASSTGGADDRMGAIWEKHYTALAGEPPFSPGWLTVNVTDYYAFRCTTANTPGILVELGVGWGADKAYLRDNINLIARTIVASWAEFGGTSTEVDVALTPEQQRLMDLLVANAQTLQYILKGANDAGPGSYADTIQRIVRLEGRPTTPTTPHSHTGTVRVE